MNLKRSLFVLGFLYIGCGGSSSDSGLVLTGTLTEGDGQVHELSFTKHAPGENIAGVEVCALGNCSVTDSAGQWGFYVGEAFTGGAVLMTVHGHGIDTDLVVDIGAQAEDVFLHLERQGDGSVIVHHMTVDGVEIEDHENSEHEESEHEHASEEEGNHEHS